MSLKRLFAICFATIILGVLLLGVLSVLMIQNEQRLNEKHEQRYYSYLLADELRQSSDDLTRMARQYVVSQDPFYEAAYHDILAIRNGEKRRPWNYHRIYWDFVLEPGDKPRPDGETVPLQQLMKQAGFTEEEFAKLRESQANSDALVQTELIAMNAVKGRFDDGTGRFVKQGPPDIERAIRIMHDADYARNKAKIMKPIDDFFALIDERTKADVNHYMSRGRWLLLGNLTLVGFLMAIAMSIGVFVPRTIFRRLGGEPAVVECEVRRIAEGDLTAEEPLGRWSGEGILGAMRHMAGRLREVAQQVRTTADRIAHQSRSVHDSSETLARASQEQAAATHEASSSMQQIVAAIRMTAENASQTGQIAAVAAEDAKMSGEAVAETVAAMQTMAQKIRVIEKIAQQTRILSLNSAIEAARSGERGKGFSVVATEVGVLADRSRKAAGEINELVESSVVVAERAGTMLSRLVPAIGETAELVRRIGEASQEQSTGAHQIQIAIQQLDEIARHGSIASAELLALAETLAYQAEFLESATSFFQLPGTSGRPTSDGSRMETSRPALASRQGSNGHGRERFGVEADARD